MSDLVAFLRKRLDEDEETARRAAGRAPSPWVGAFKQVTSEPDEIQSVASTEAAAISHHIARHDPARVLREVEAKRKILDEYTGPDDGMHSPDYWEGLALAICALAAVYSDHPDYDPARGA